MRRLTALLPALLATVLSAAGATLSLAQTASPPAAAAAQVRHFPPDEDLQVMLDYLVEDGETPGIVLGILEADGSTRILQAGSAGPGTRPLGPRTVFEIGSINKTFTGTILAGMVARGEVKLDDPVQKYLPSNVRVPSRNGRQITLLDLATHRSGLPRLPNNHVPADRGNPYADYTVEKLYAFLSNHELRRDVGAEFEYSNLGFGLLGHALGRAAGKPFEQLVQERILGPLGMEMTGYGREGEMGAWHARGHDGRGQVVSFWEGTDAIHGAGGLRSSLEDMLDYLRAQLGPADTELERAMRVAQRAHQQYPENALGLAWAIRTVNGRTIVSHGGGTGGFSTMIAFDPERRAGFVMLTNTGDFGDDLAMDFLVRGAPLDLPEVRVPREALARYAGEYQPATGRPIFVRLEDDGTMTIRVGGNVRFRMHAESDSTFYLKRAPWRVRFTRDAAGAVSGLALNVDGTEQTARRIGDRALTPREEAAAVRDLPLPAEEMARYEGTYTLRLGEQSMALRVFVQDGRLMSQATGQPAFRLRSQGSHVFIPDFDDEVRLVFTVQNGRAAGLTLHQGGREIPGTRTQ
ncbi:MAG TPA: serine hydrolase domain-containing protein [Longimicrobium sp.]|nr:serine hydrolase domain-containing protein [Longimicrobium sp.]